MTAGVKHGRSPILAAYNVDALPFKRLRISVPEEETLPPAFTAETPMLEQEPTFLTRGKRTQDDAMDIDSDDQYYKVDMEALAKKRLKQKAREDSRALIRLPSTAASAVPDFPLDPTALQMPKQYLPVLQHILRHRLSPMEGLAAYRRMKAKFERDPDTSFVAEEASLDDALSVVVRHMDTSQWLSFCQRIYDANGGADIPLSDSEEEKVDGEKTPFIVELTPEEAAALEREEAMRQYSVHPPLHAVPTSITVEEPIDQAEDDAMEF